MQPYSYFYFHYYYAFSDFSSVFDFVKDLVGSESLKQNHGHRLLVGFFVEKYFHPVEVTVILSHV